MNVKCWNSCEILNLGTFILMSRYYLRFMDPRNSKELVAKSKEK